MLKITWSPYCLSTIPWPVFFQVQIENATLIFLGCHSAFRYGCPDSREPCPVDEMVGQDLDRLWTTSQRSWTEVHDFQRRHLLGGRRVRSRFSCNLCSWSSCTGNNFTSRVHFSWFVVIFFSRFKSQFCHK